MKRRQFLATTAGALVGGLTAQRPVFASEPSVTLTSAPTTTSLVGAEAPATDIWAYNGTVPGPILRAAQNDELIVSFENGLSEASVWWYTAL